MNLKFQRFDGSPLTGSTIIVYPSNGTLLDGSQPIQMGYLSGSTDNNGNYSQSMAQGYYNILINNYPETQLIVEINPNDTIAQVISDNNLSGSSPSQDVVFGFNSYSSGSSVTIIPLYDVPFISSSICTVVTADVLTYSASNFELSMTPGQYQINMYDNWSSTFYINVPNFNNTSSLPWSASRLVVVPAGIAYVI